MSRAHTQAKVGQEKAAHPERFCPEPRCLWKTGGSRCPRHRRQEPAPVDAARNVDSGAAMFQGLIEDAATAAEHFEADDLEDFAREWRACPMCNGEGAPLGQLGHLLHFRCRQCGWDFSREVPR